MNGVDAIVFTAGVGEHAPEVRRRLCDGVRFLGVTLDESRNRGETGDAIISAEGATVSVHTVAAHENWVVANDVLRLTT